MQAAPGEDTHESIVELQPFREAVVDCIEQLSEQDRFIIDAINTEMIPLDELGTRLGVTKTHAWRLKNTAMDNLRAIMLKNATIRERLILDDEETSDDWF